MWQKYILSVWFLTHKHPGEMVFYFYCRKKKCVPIQLSKGPAKSCNLSISLFVVIYEINCKRISFLF